MNEIFTTVRLNLGHEVQVREVKGKHLLQAIKASSSKDGNFLQELMTATLIVEDQPATVEFIDGLSGSDFLELLEAINIQLEPQHKFKIPK